GAFFGFGGKEPISPSDVLTRFCLERRRFGLAFFPLFIHPIHPVRHPATAAFEKSDPQFWEFLRHAAIDKRGAIDQSLERARDGVREKKSIETDFSRRALAGIVNQQWRIEPLQLFVNRPKRRGAEMILQAEGR